MLLTHFGLCAKEDIIGRLTVLVRTTITKYHRLGSWKSKHLFLQVLEAGKSTIKEPADLMSGERPLVVLQMSTFSLDGRGDAPGSLSLPIMY